MTGMDDYGLKEEFPQLWALAAQFDFVERGGGHPSADQREADAALRELWMSRAGMPAIRKVQKQIREDGGLDAAIKKALR